MAEEVLGGTYIFEDNHFPLRSLRLDFDGPAEAILRLDLASEIAPRVDRIGLDGVFRPSIRGRPIVARGHWDGPRTFVMKIHEGPGISAYDIRVRFEGRLLQLEVLGVTVSGSARAET